MSYMNYEQTTVALDRGNNVARRSWRPRSTFVYRNAAGTVSMCSEDLFVIPWSPKIEDVLAEDWYIYE